MSPPTPEVNTEDPVLLARTAGGDDDAFDELVRRHQGRVRAFLAARLARADDVDDLAQDVFIAVFRSADRFDGRDAVWPWIKGIATHILQGHLRSRYRDRLRPVERLEETIDQLGAAAMEALDDDDERVLGALGACLETLSPEARELVRRRYADGAAVDELARELRRKAHSLSVTLLRIRRALRTCIEGRLGSPLAGSSP